ncbi:MAG: sigma-54 dependent transcriptional regulator [Desulfatitalea sp.]
MVPGSGLWVLRRATCKVRGTNFAVSLMHPIFKTQTRWRARVQDMAASQISSAENANSLCFSGISGPSGQIGFQGVVGKSRAMQQVFRLIERVADSDSTILINGETGTGKGLVAKAIHSCSYRKDKPFVAINCGAIPENLLESELFGHVKGAFTGATSAKIGKFEVANGGTIFLDEIGDMSPDLQVKVLKVLEEREFEPVGGCKSVRVDVRIIAATHRDLEEEVQKGNFREDLFYRLYVIPIQLPALQDRPVDVPLLTHYFLNKLNQDKNTRVCGICQGAMEILMQHTWPGNVRELANMMERMVVLKGEGEIQVNDLPAKLRPEGGHEIPTVVVATPEIDGEGICLNTAVSEFEKNLIYQSLEKTDWVKNKAAKLLHVKRTTLVEKIKRYDLQKCA